MKRNRYDSIDGLKALAAIGIVLIHVKANNNYNISGFAYNKIIASLGNFIFLFMMISAFGLCCGYHEKMLSGNISVSDFYKKRIIKIWPFFGLLVLMDVILSHSISALCEGFADLTLMFGFIPNEISVIGVGWFIGLIFIFYLAFPFFCFLTETKARAWTVFAASIVANIICANYFNLTGRNFLFSFCFFVAGGLIYLYKDKIEKINPWIAFILVCASIAVYCLFETTHLTILLSFVCMLIFAITYNGKLLNNPAAKFISGISFEIYLSHMFIFRIIEKLKLNTVLNNDIIQYILTSVLVLIGSIVFSVAVKYGFKILSEKISKRCKNENFNS